MVRPTLHIAIVRPVATIALSTYLQKDTWIIKVKFFLSHFKV